MTEQANDRHEGNRRSDCPVVLHLSDLHFGKAVSEQGKHDRKLICDSLVETLLKLEGEEWKPSHLCITGDITDKGKPSGYREAGNWLLVFMERLSIGVDAVFVCPGNHDVDWKAVKDGDRPGTAEAVDEVLSVPLPSHLVKPFAKYTAFLKKVGIPQYSYSADGRRLSYIFGIRNSNENLAFVCCNSCFFSWDDASDKALMIGNSVLNYLQSERLLLPEPEHATIVVALMHHSKEQLDESEYASYERRPPAFTRLSQMTHIILTGHDHATARPWVLTGYGAYSAGIGAAFLGVSHPNTFQLFRVNWANERYESRYFQWDPRIVRWQEVTHLQNKWPFTTAIKRLAASDATTSEPVSRQAERLSDDLWDLIQKRDFAAGLLRWAQDSDWFQIHKHELKRDVAETIMLYVEELKSESV
jgi:hypothetical protein